LPSLIATENYATMRKVVGKLSQQLTVANERELINILLCIITYAKAGG